MNAQIKKNSCDFNEEGCIRLLCRIAEIRANSYRSAYRAFCKNPNAANLDKVNHYERKLKKFPTSLDQSDIKRLQKQAIESIY